MKQFLDSFVRMLAGLEIAHLILKMSGIDYL